MSSAVPGSAGGAGPHSGEVPGPASYVYVIRLVETRWGPGATPFDGLYVRRYDPTYVHPEGYDGGLLEVCERPQEAQRFPSPAAALLKYRESYGVRPDGEPDRPLTAWSIEILPLEEGGES